MNFNGFVVCGHVEMSARLFNRKSQNVCINKISGVRVCLCMSVRVCQCERVYNTAMLAHETQKL